MEDDGDGGRVAGRIALVTIGALAAMLGIAAIVRPDMVMGAMHMVMHATRSMVGM